MCAQGYPIDGERIYSLTVQGGLLMPKVRKGFRFSPWLYEDFKDLAFSERIPLWGVFALSVV